MNDVATVMINAVTQKAITTQRGPTTLFILDTSQGDMTTFDKVLAQSAFSLKGQMAQATYRSQPNGNFPPKQFLESILPAQVSPAVQAQQAQSHGAQMFTENVAGIPEADADKAAKAQLREQSIHRQCATKVAAACAPPSREQFWAFTEELVRFYQTGQAPNAIEAALVDQFDARQDTNGFTQADDIPF